MGETWIASELTFVFLSGFCPYRLRRFSRVPLVFVLVKVLRSHIASTSKGVFALLAVFTLKNRDFCDCQDARHSGRLAAE